jgi:heterodisulfide reductase subunit C
MKQTEKKKEPPVRDPLEELIDEKKLSLCVECGKCVASCPMAELYQAFSYGFSARGVIKKALLGLDLLNDSDIWFCLECDTCARLCPAGVKYAEFVEGVRQLAVSEGIIEHCLFCERCGRYYIPVPTIDRLHEILKELKLSSEYSNLCPQCRRDDVAEKVAYPAPAARERH